MPAIQAITAMTWKALSHRLNADGFQSSSTANNASAIADRDPGAQHWLKLFHHARVLTIIGLGCKADCIQQRRRSYLHTVPAHRGFSKESKNLILV